MTDFLSNLAAKNLNRAPVIQPRLLSRFEPARRVMAAEPQLASSTLETVSTLESDTPHPSTAVPRQAPAASTPIDPQPRSVESLLRQSPLISQPRLEPPPIAPQALEQRREVQSEIVNATYIRSVVEQPLSSAPTHERVIIEKQRAEPDRAALPSELERTAKSLPPEEHTAIPARPIVTPVIERVVHDRIDRTQPQAIQTEASRDNSSQMRNVEQPPITEPPTIHVTIGRIEVRATSAAAPAKHSPGSTAALSLDEYLRARDGGKR